MEDPDLHVVNWRAKEMTRKAMQKEERIMDNITETDKIKKNNEVDEMLIDSLKAKIKILDGL
jgi:hypothetical protein